MNKRFRQGSVALAAAAAALTIGQLVGFAGAPQASASEPQPVPQSLPSGTRFYTPKPSHDAIRQIAELTSSGQKGEVQLIRDEVETPQAVWFTGGSPKQVTQGVRQVAQQASGKKSVPTLVVYNVPGRDCSQYSSGGASSDAAYRAWIDGFAAGLRKNQQVIVIVEPDGLANLPSDCASAYPGQDIVALTAGRIADIKYAGETIAAADPRALVYLDAGHSAWHSVIDMTDRLTRAGVSDVQGFSLNVSNYQFTSNLQQYGTWISECIAYTTKVAPGDVGSCGDMYWSGGPANNWSGVALDANGQWGDTADQPTLNTAGINSRYASILGTTVPTTHFVIDTSRNGQGPWTPAATANYPDAQTWCNPPNAGLGARPQASPQPALPLLDAYLWIKTPGQSDGQCNRGVAGSTTDPEWGGIVDPAAGAWFPQQALRLAQLAEPPLG